MKIKRILLCVIALTLAVMLVACNNANSSEEQDINTKTEENPVSTQEEPAIEELDAIAEPVSDSTVFDMSAPENEWVPSTQVLLSTVEVDDIILVGGYGWRVLDKQDGKVLVLSEKIVTTLQFRTKVPGMDDLDYIIRWENSPFRDYLNTTFYNETFNAREKEMIVETLIKTESHPWFGASGGNDTHDKLFLLSYEEVVQYFGDSGQFGGEPLALDADRWADRFQAVYVDDEYNAARIAQDIETDEPFLWWLRSPGYSLEAAHITDDGKIYMGLHYNEHLYMIAGGIRPAMWLSTGPEEQAVVHLISPLRYVETDMVIEAIGKNTGEISEDEYIELMNGLSADFRNNIGKTIRFEGNFTSYGDFHAVVRFTTMCCGPDGGIGFLIVWDGDLPKRLDTVEITGTFALNELFGDTFQTIEVSSMELIDAPQIGVPRHLRYYGD